MALVLEDGVWKLQADSGGSDTPDGAYTSPESTILIDFGGEYETGDNVNFFATGSVTGSFQCFYILTTIYFKYFQKFSKLFNFTQEFIMARPSLPTLTWNKSSVYEYENATTTDVLTGISASVAASTHWNVIDFNVADTNHYFVEIGPKASTAGVGKQRLVFAAQGTGSFNSGIMGKGGTAATRVGLPSSTEIMCLYAPEGSDGSKVASFPDNTGGDPNIYGGSTRTMGYYGNSIDVDGDALYKVWIIESAEVICVAIEDTTNNKEYGGIWGPMWIGASTSTGDVDTTDRIYGGAWVGNGLGAFWSTNTDFLNDSGTNTFNVQRTMCFNPNGGAEIYGLYMFSPGGNRAPDSTGNLISRSGLYLALDVNHFAHDTKGDGSLVPDVYIGTLRQIRMGRDFTSRIVVQDGSGNDEAIVWGSHPSTNSDAVWFTNS